MAVRVSVTLSDEVAGLLATRASRDRRSVSATAALLLEVALGPGGAVAEGLTPDGRSDEVGPASGVVSRVLEGRR
jgi:hypothetical protein